MPELDNESEAPTQEADAGTNENENETPKALLDLLKDAPNASEMQEALTLYMDGEVKGLKSALGKERDAAKTAAAALKKHERATAKAADTALADNKEFETLAEQRQVRIEELEPLAAQADESLKAMTARVEAAETALQSYLDAEIEGVGLPDPIRELLSGKTLIQQLEWLVKHKAEFAKSSDGRTLPGSPNGDQGNGGTRLTIEDRKKRTARTTG